MRNDRIFVNTTLHEIHSKKVFFDKDIQIFKDLIKKDQLSISEFETYKGILAKQLHSPILKYEKYESAGSFILTQFLLKCIFYINSVLGLFHTIAKSSRPGNALRMIVPPGSLARIVLSFVFSKKAFDRVFAQAIIDMREEHAEALANGDLWKARWVVVRDHVGLFLTVLSYLGANIVKRAVGIWKLIP